MKTIHLPFLLIALASTLLTQAQPPETYAAINRPVITPQSDENAVPGNTPAGPSNGYWRLHTEAGSRTTVVRFYRADNQLLYEESMGNRYVRLTKRNVARLDNMLNRLVSGTLIASSVKAQPMNEVSAESAIRTRADATRQVATVSPTNKKGYAIDATGYYQARFNRLFLTVVNPDRHRMDIMLLDEQKHLHLFWETDNGPEYMRRLSLTELPAGHYTLVIKTVDRTFRYSQPVHIKN